VSPVPDASVTLSWLPGGASARDEAEAPRVTNQLGAHVSDRAGTGVTGMIA
jgi:hypothetical protein